VKYIILLTWNVLSAGIWLPFIRASYLGALHKQLEKRNFDYSEIGGKGSMSLKSKEKPDINPNNGLWKVIPDKNEAEGYEEADISHVISRWG